MKTLTTLALSLAVSTSAMAYEPQHINMSHPDTSRLLALVADSMNFKSSARGMQLTQQKTHLAACVVDQLIDDALHYGVQVESIIMSEIWDLTQYYDADYWGRGVGISKEKTEYYNELDYACVDYHWDPEGVTKRMIIIEYNDQLRSKCGSFENWTCHQEMVDSIYHDMMGIEPEPEIVEQPTVTHEMERDDELGLTHLGDNGAIEWIIRMTNKYEKIDLLKNYSHNSIRMYFYCHLQIVDIASEDHSTFIKNLATVDTWYDNYKSYGNLNILTHDDREEFQFFRNHCVPNLEM